MKNKVFQENNENYRDVVEGLTALQNIFVTTYINCGQNLAETAHQLNRTRVQADKIMGSEKVQWAISNRLKQMEPVGQSVLHTVRVCDDESYTGASKREKLDMLWALAQEASGKIYDKEGNEVIMNGAVAVSAVRTMNDMVGDWAPKETNINVDIKDDRSIDEVKRSVEALMAEYTTLSGEMSAEVQAIENVGSLSVD
jgi:hypothetical protein